MVWCNEKFALHIFNYQPIHILFIHFVCFISLQDASISDKKMLGSDSMDQHVHITTAAAFENALKQKKQHEMVCG